VTASQNTQPILVLAPARSYSSIFAACLGANPACYAFPELELCHGGETVGDILENDRLLPLGFDRYCRSGLLRALAELTFGDQSSDSVIRARDWLTNRSQWTGTCVMSHLFALVAPKRAVEKSPGTTRSNEAIARCVSRFRRASFVHLIRDPLSTATSWARLVSGYGAYSRNDLIVQGLEVWYAAHLRIMTIGQWIDPSRFLTVRAEDFLADPVEWLRRCADTFGLPSSCESIESMTHPERSSYASLGPPEAPGGFDPAFLRAPQLQIHPLARQGRFDELIVPPDLLARICELGARFGYRDFRMDPGVPSEPSIAVNDTFCDGPDTLHASC